MKLICRHNLNARGRDFIVGDLHGCLFHLELVLDKAKFDPANDRLFSTGDLADRGPDSPGCLALLKEPWFLPVLGNHDLCLLQFLRGLEDGKDSKEADEALEILFHNGGDWIPQALKPLLNQMPDIAETLESIPLIRSIGTTEDTSRFHVAHGDFYAGTTVLTDVQLDAFVTDPSEELTLVEGTMTAREFSQHVTWSRRLFKNPGHYGTIAELSELSRTYVGHSIVRSLKRVASHLFIDGGAYLPRGNESTYGLNLIDHLNQRHYWTNGFEVRISALSFDCATLHDPMPAGVSSQS